MTCFTETTVSLQSGEIAPVSGLAALANGVGPFSEDLGSEDSLPVGCFQASEPLGVQTLPSIFFLYL